MVQHQARPIIPEALLIPCPALPDAKDGKLGTLLQNHVEVVHAYHTCARRHGDLADVARRLSEGAK